MAVSKLSQILAATSNPTGTSTFVAAATPVDLLYTLNQLQAALAPGLITATANMTFYVATTGNDNNPGTIGSPVASLERAFQLAANYNWTANFSPTIQIADGTYHALNNSQILIPPMYPFGAIQATINGNLTTPGNVIINCPFGVVASGAGSLWDMSGVTVDAASQAYAGQLGGTLLLGLNGPCQFQDSTGGGGCTVLDGETTGTVQIRFGSTFNVLSSPFCMLAAQNYGTAESGGTIHIANPVNGATGSSVGWYEVFDYGNVNLFFGSYTGAAINNYPKFQAFTYGTINEAKVPWLAGTGQTLGQIDNTAAVNTVIGGNVDHTVVVPTTGSTVTIPQGQLGVILNPAGTLASLTVALPAVWNPNNTQTIWISTTKAITALTITAPAGVTVSSGVPTSLIAGQGFSLSYNNSDTTWYLQVGGGGGSASPGSAVFWGTF